MKQHKPSIPLLKDLRKSAKISQEKMSKNLGISTPTYAKYETGENPVSVAVLVAIADLFNASTDYLLGREK